MLEVFVEQVQLHEAYSVFVRRSRQSAQINLALPRYFQAVTFEVREYYLLGKIEILRIGPALRFGLAAVFGELVFYEMENVDVLLLGVELASVDPKQQVPHGVVVYEGLEAVTCQVKVFALVVLNNLVLLVTLLEGLLVQLIPVYLKIV